MNRYTFIMVHIRETERLRMIGKVYYDRCYQYELSVCSGRTKEGEPVPIDDRERSQVNTNSRKLFEHVRELHGLSKKEMMKALRLARGGDSEPRIR